MNTPAFVAEVSSNHNRQFERCREFIDASARIGCDAVKFQLFKIDQLFAPEILTRSERHRARRQWELPEEFIPDLSAYSHERGLAFSCTPFYLQAVDLLADHVDFYKIASYELLWSDLLRACAQTGKPVVLSTGMATLAEVEGAVEVMISAGCRDIQLLHCVSGYPTPVDQCNLAAIQTLREATACQVGWSDHSVSSAVVQRAVHRWGAHMVEFHLDLDGQGDEFKTGHCWLPQPMMNLIDSIRAVQTADGDGIKQPAAAELADRDWRADPGDGLRPMKAIREKAMSTC